MQVGRADRAAGVRIKDHDVSVRADREHAFARVHPHDARRRGRQDLDEAHEREAAFAHSFGIEHREKGLEI